MVSRAGGPFQRNPSHTICPRFRKVRWTPLEAFYRRRQTSLRIVCWARENGLFPGICGGACRGHHPCSEAAANHPMRIHDVTGCNRCLPSVTSKHVVSPKPWSEMQPRRPRNACLRGRDRRVAQCRCPVRVEGRRHIRGWGCRPVKAGGPTLRIGDRPVRSLAVASIRVVVRAIRMMNNSILTDPASIRVGLRTILGVQRLAHAEVIRRFPRWIAGRKSVEVGCTRPGYVQRPELLALPGCSLDRHDRSGGSRCFLLPGDCEYDHILCRCWSKSRHPPGPRFACACRPNQACCRTLSRAGFSPRVRAFGRHHFN